MIIISSSSSSTARDLGTRPGCHGMARSVLGSGFELRSWAANP